MRYLIPLLLLSSGCAHQEPPDLQVNWDFEQTSKGTKACLSEEDVSKLQDALDRCRAQISR